MGMKSRKSRANRKCFAVCKRHILNGNAIALAWTNMHDAHFAMYRASRDHEICIDEIYLVPRMKFEELEKQGRTYDRSK